MLSWVLSHFSRVWLCNPMDCSLPGSSVHGVLQIRILEWLAITHSRGSSPPRDWTRISYISCITSAGGFFITSTPWEAQINMWPPYNIHLKDHLSHLISIVFLYFFALIAEEGFLISSRYSLELFIQMLISFLFSFAFRFSSFHSYL